MYNSLSISVPSVFVKISLLFALLFSSFSIASPRYYMNRVSPNLLPTGCQLGWGPQYQSFDGFLGRKVVIGSREFFDFNPVKVCRAAAKICQSELSGQACCVQACRQQNTGVGTREKAVISQAGFKECTQKCPGVPSFKSERVNVKRQLEAPMSIRYVNK